MDSSSSSSTAPAHSTSSSLSSSSSSLPSLPAASHITTVKLDRDNFLLWKSQIVPILKSQRIYKYLDDSYVVPPPHITDSQTNSLIPNPAYEDWECLDQTLLTWINSSLTDPIKAECVNKPSSRDVWRYLEQTYATLNPARLLQLKTSLSRIQKGNLSISEYVLKIKEIADSLASVLEPVSDLELVSTTLRGLGPDYAPFYAAITTWPTLPSFSELHALLLHHETHFLYLQSLQNPVSDLTNSSAFYSGSSSSSRGQFSHRGKNSFNSGRRFQGSGRGRGSSSYYSHNGSRNFNNNYNTSGGRGSSYSGSSSILGASPTTQPVTCQLCGKRGHTVHTCHQRLDLHLSLLEVKV
ncbi:hypothetical protein BVC80_1635g17 [Macleaya cordata]|uniref:Retrotransposon Copia-like N-terminal domain-containing protein n=1 Tax=Macleaya cordata TaxID=56857 RepID=A0A200Q6P4_MACCD|nr:hypothetical protein BVC80_1635g17 [Macleaya cordata]